MVPTLPRICQADLINHGNMGDIFRVEHGEPTHDHAAHGVTNRRDLLNT